MGKIKALTGKVFYGLLFVTVIPFLLILWAKYTDNIVKLPLPENLLFGYILLIAGTLFVFSGMTSKYGKMFVRRVKRKRKKKVH